MLKPEQRAMTVLLGALIAVAPLAMDIYLASMPSMSQALSATREQVQLTLSVYLWGWGLAQLVAGPLSDRYGRRRVLSCGLVVFVVSSAACAAATEVMTLVYLRFIQALSMATVVVIPRAMVRDLYAGDRAARMLALMSIVLGIAPVVAPILGAFLHGWYGWRSTFVFTATYGAILLMLVWRVMPETIAATNPHAIDPRVMVHNYLRLLGCRRFVGYMAVTAFTYCGLFAFIAGSAFVFVEGFGNSEQDFAFLFGTVMLGTISGAAFSSSVVLRWGSDRLIGVGGYLMLSAGIGLMALAWGEVNHPLAVVVPMFFFTFAQMMTVPQVTAGALSPFPDIAGSAASLLSFAQFALASGAALAVGLTFDGTALPMATIIALSSLLSFIAFRALVVPNRAARS